MVDGYTYRAEGAAHQDQEYRAFSKANGLSCLFIIIIVSYRLLSSAFILP